MGRMLELRLWLADFQTATHPNVDRVLMSLDKVAEDLEPCVPHYFVNDRREVGRSSCCGCRDQGPTSSTSFFLEVCVYLSHTARIIWLRISCWNVGRKCWTLSLSSAS